MSTLPPIRLHYTCGPTVYNYAHLGNLLQQLEARGVTYTAGGNVYFDLHASTADGTDWYSR